MASPGRGGVVRAMSKSAFEAAMHGPLSSHTLSDLGYGKKATAWCSSFAYSDPFPMLSYQFCQAVRNELLLEMSSDLTNSEFYHCSLNLCDLWSSDTFSNLINRVPVVVHDSSLGISTKIRRISKSDVSSDEEWQVDKAGFTCIIILSETRGEEQSVEVHLKQGDGEVKMMSFPVGGLGYAMLIQSSCVPYKIQSLHDCYGIIVHLEPADGWADEDNGTPSYDSTLDVDDLPSSLEDGMLSSPDEETFDIIDNLVPNAFLPSGRKGTRRLCNRCEEEMFIMELDG
eukprot:753969-Hanusia_phi.AAC.2